jgi:aspartyl-tRNA(Asn)/glutamyl-tRNA(Gln) amidotransferase subunit A
MELFDEAETRAHTLDPSLPLYGLLYTVKDIFQVGSYPTRAGTQASLPEIGPEGPAVASLRSAGALCVGKANTHEIALGLTGENQWTGDVKNPFDANRQSGGSSSGSAVSVAIGACDFSIGTDTAGSIRVPASYCGVLGYKPTYGAVSLAGAVPLVPSCDHIGVIAKDIDLLVSILRVWDIPVGTLSDISRPVCAIPKAYLRGRLSGPVEECFDTFCERYVPDSVELELPDPLRCMDMYGKLRRDTFNLYKATINNNPERFSPRVLELLQSGDVLEEEYLEARRWQYEYASEIAGLLSTCDILILPTAPTPAPLIGTNQIELTSGRVPLRDALMPLTLPFSMAGVPTISLPLLSAEGLPVGVQLVARRGADSALVRFAKDLITRVKGA